MNLSQSIHSNENINHSLLVKVLYKIVHVFLISFLSPRTEESPLARLYKRKPTLRRDACPKPHTPPEETSVPSLNSQYLKEASMGLVLFPLVPRHLNGG